MTTSRKGTDADGGFALVTDARSQILQAITGPDSLLGRLESLFTSGNSITLPVDEDPAWSGAGIHSHVVGESVAYTPTTPILKQLSITLAKKGVLVYVTDEMLSDVANIGDFVTRKSAEKLTYALNAAIFAEFLAGASIKTVAKTSGAASGSAPDLANIEAMWVGLHTGFRRNAIWLANPNLEPVLRSMVLANSYNSLYMPPGGLAATPYATLMGKPLIFTELAAAIGTTGDLMVRRPQRLLRRDAERRDPELGLGALQVRQRPHRVQGHRPLRRQVEARRSHHPARLDDLLVVRRAGNPRLAASRFHRAPLSRGGLTWDLEAKGV